MSFFKKMTEDEVVTHLENYFKRHGWTVKCCYGQTTGVDIDAIKGERRLLIEAKGARAGDKSPTKKREFFDKGQILTHFGKGLLKVLNDKYKYPSAEIGIAHPNDTQIKAAIGHLIPMLKKMDLKFYWINDDGSILID